MSTFQRVVLGMQSSPGIPRIVVSCNSSTLLQKQQKSIKPGVFFHSTDFGPAESQVSNTQHVEVKFSSKKHLCYSVTARLLPCPITSILPHRAMILNPQAANYESLIKLAAQTLADLPALLQHFYLQLWLTLRMKKADKTV